MVAVGTYRLILKTGYVLDLEDVFYIPSFSRNLISVSKLDVFGLVFGLSIQLSVFLEIIILLVVE
jgi:hypothetical protein